MTSRDSMYPALCTVQKYIQKTEEIVKRYYSRRQSLDIILLSVSRKEIYMHIYICITIFLKDT